MDMEDFFDHVKYVMETDELYEKMKELCKDYPVESVLGASSLMTGSAIVSLKILFNVENIEEIAFEKMKKMIRNTEKDFQAKNKDDLHPSQ